jgi:hypothetical protein
MLTNKGYSLIIWTATFAIIIAGLMFIQVPLKRGIQSKVRATADYVLWGLWGNTPEQFWRDENSKEKSNATQQQTEERLSLHSGMSKVYRDVLSENKGISAGVDKGSEVLLKTFDLNQF